MTKLIKDQLDGESVPFNVPLIKFPEPKYKQKTNFVKVNRE